MPSNERDRKNERVDDIFCQIARGELVADIVLRTPTVVAFLDHRPVFKGHVLICPTDHIATLPELPLDRLADFFACVRWLSTALPESLGCQGTFVALNNVVSQSVPHLHVHVVPRTKGDGLRGFLWPRTRYADDEAAGYAERIRQGLDATRGR